LAGVTTCAYCGVGCSFKAEMRGDELVRMVPYKDGEANRGHSCVKGRFAWGYATHRERVLKPMIRAKITDPWKEVSWQEAIDYAASEFKRIQAKYGKDFVGGITSSRCTNEETFLVQKLIRAAFGNNNVDTCARVCHSPKKHIFCKKQKFQKWKDQKKRKSQKRNLSGNLRLEKRLRYRRLLGWRRNLLSAC
jgi:formate dehydrogenase major subunit